MSRPLEENALGEALVRFETCLETPVVPGELPQWCQTAKDACGELGDCLRREINQIHPEMFRQIQSEDPGLAARVAALRDDDIELVSQMGHVETIIARLSAAANAVEPHESRVDEQVQSVVDSGLQLVLAARKQETAITTWYMEALERDRGTVD